jgi:hypothetical protein
MVRVVVPVQGVIAVVGEAISGEVAAGRHDAVVGRQDVALAVGGKGRGQELHGALRASSAHPGDAAEAGFDQVDRRQVCPVDTGRRFRLAVVTEQLVGRPRRDDAPRRQRVFRSAHCNELPTRVDVAVVDFEERRRDSRARDRVPLGVASEGTVGRLLAVGRRHQHSLR